MEEWNVWDATWLDRHYTGAPDECPTHWPEKVPCRICNAKEQRSDD